MCSGAIHPPIQSHVTASDDSSHLQPQLHDHNHRGTINQRDWTHSTINSSSLLGKRTGGSTGDGDMWRKKRWLFLLICIVVIGIGIALFQRSPTIEPGSYLMVNLGGSFTEAPKASLLQELLSGGQQNLTDMILQLRKAALDLRLKGAVLRISPMNLSFAELQDLRDALTHLRKAGKEVIAWVMGEDGSGVAEYYLASAANRIYYAENTLLPLLGLRANYIFLGGLWEKLDIDMQVEKIREYKTFGDLLIGREMTKAHREMANSLLDSLNHQLLHDIAEARELTPEAVQTLIDGPTMTPADFQRVGLIDGIRYFDDVLDSLKAAGETEAKTVSMSTYRRVKPSVLGLQPEAKIALVYGIGGIVTGQSDWRATGANMGSDTIVAAIDHAAKDDTIAAIVFRVDSPGGSPLASDQIWHAVVRAKSKKPVIVSMSGAAASGGYYIAAGATRIVAQPATLTGSIGIVFSHANIAGLLGKLGIHTATVSRGAHARLLSLTKSWSPEERQQIQRLMEDLYDTFTQKVAQGRHMAVSKVDEVGRGRVWTGAQAKEIGLVDELGGLTTALQIAKEQIGLSANAVAELLFFPKPKGILMTLLERFGIRAQTPLPEPLGRVADQLMLLAREGSGQPLFTMPYLLQID
jgi:protease-4